MPRSFCTRTSPLPDGEPYVRDGADHKTLAALMYTSGTTGFPKGAMVTHENFLSNIETCVRALDTPATLHIRNLISVPLFHATGCNSQFLPTIHLGGTAVIMPTFDVQAFLRATADEKINVLTSVPAVFWLAMNQPNFAEFDMTDVGWVTYGGAPTAPDVVARLRSRSRMPGWPMASVSPSRRRCRPSCPMNMRNCGRRPSASPRRPSKSISSIPTR